MLFQPFNSASEGSTDPLTDAEVKLRDFLKVRMITAEPVDSSNLASEPCVNISLDAPQSVSLSTTCSQIPHF